MAQQKANPAVRFLVAFLIVIAVALVAFFVGYLIGMRLAVLPVPACRVSSRHGGARQAVARHREEP